MNPLIFILLSGAAMGVLFLGIDIANSVGFNDCLHHNSISNCQELESR
jgi:hypothetical protein